MNPYVCTCTYHSCDKAKHTVEGVGVVPGRVLSRQIYHEHQRKEAQRAARERQSQLEKTEENQDPTEVSLDSLLIGILLFGS